MLFMHVSKARMADGKMSYLELQYINSPQHRISAGDKQPPIQPCQPIRYSTSSYGSNHKDIFRPLVKCIFLEYVSARVLTIGMYGPTETFAKTMVKCRESSILPQDTASNNEHWTFHTMSTH